MVRFLCRHATIMLVFTIGNCRAVLIDSNYYMPFLADLQEYYKISGISILYDDNVEGLEMQTNIAGFLRGFSNRLIPTQALHYSRVEEKADYDISVHAESLFVAFLTSERVYENYRRATQGYDMSYHTWLAVFIGDRMNGLCYQPTGNPFHLYFNSRMIVLCHADLTIYKWYSIYRNRTEVLELAKWDKDRNVIFENQNYYESRFDLSGKVIRVATPTNSTSDTSAKMYGFFNDLFRELQSFMNFTLTNVYETDAFGKYDPTNDTWSGLIGHLSDGEVDLVVAPVTITKYRMDYVDFSKPLILSSNRLYIKQPLGARVPWSAYFQAFSISSWGSIATTLVVSSLLTAYIRAMLEKSKLARKSMNYVLENFIRIWGIYCQQGVPDLPSEIPLRLVYVTVMLLTLVIWNVYSASICSYLTVLTPSLPFSDTKGFVDDGSYKVIVVQNSSDQSAILSTRE
ncbi:glutamate receptor ionotropic, kainate 5-like [Copidosoma floridanum]|uniref:glutamate receptor ionotropic, kainate 5-like n=1 Tax=Copidosoma floridanum TaxID=29053 RepID=UPI000C6F527C|nr:glutamate receptor ionotropic, kainate 5-like [Copidosoma floridanum]